MNRLQKIVQDYGKVLEATAHWRIFGISDALLPYTKDEIKAAIKGCLLFNLHGEQTPAGKLHRESLYSGYSELAMFISGADGEIASRANRAFQELEELSGDDKATVKQCTAEKRQSLVDMVVAGATLLRDKILPEQERLLKEILEVSKSFKDS